MSVLRRWLCCCLFIWSCFIVWVLCRGFGCWCGSWCLLKFSIHLVEEDSSGCCTLIDLYILCSVSLFCGTMGRSEVCDYDTSWSYSLMFWSLCLLMPRFCFNANRFLCRYDNIKGYEWTFYSVWWLSLTVYLLARNIDINIYLDDLPVSCPSSSAFEDDDRTLTVLLLPSILNIVNGRGGPSSRSCVVPIPTRLVRPSLER